MSWTQVPFTELVQARGSGSSGLPQSEWAEQGRFPVIGQGVGLVEGWTDREDLALTPSPAVVLYGGHTRRAKYVDRPFVPGPNVRILVPEARLDPKFLYHYLSQLQIESRGYADHFPEVRRCNIPLPPLDEQRRIAAILDKADALRAKRRDAIAKLDELLKSVFLDMFGEPLSNPKKWPRRPLAEIALVQTGGTPPTSAAGMFDGDIPFITPSDLGGEVETSRRTVTRKGAEAARVAKAGSTLVCCIGATIGKMGFIRRDGAFNQQINAVTWTGAVLPLYGYHAMRFLSNEIAHKGASTTLPILKKSSFEKLELIVPPLAEQNRFNEFAERMTVQNKKLQSSANSLSETFSSLQSVLFRGS